MRFYHKIVSVICKDMKSWHGCYEVFHEQAKAIVAGLMTESMYMTTV